MKKKLIATLAAVGIMMAVGVSNAEAGQYWQCRSGTHSIGTSNASYASYLRAIGYYCTTNTIYG